jgi:hypothetical protein
VATLAIGSDATGITATAPRSQFDRWIGINDAGDHGEVLAVWLHEAAHSFLMSPARADLSIEEEIFYSSGGAAWFAAQSYGLEEQLLQRQIRDEAQACALARVWGASGTAVDAEFCARHLHVRLLSVRAERARVAHGEE